MAEFGQDIWFGAEATLVLAAATRRKGATSMALRFPGSS